MELVKMAYSITDGRHWLVLFSGGILYIRGGQAVHFSKFRWFCNRNTHYLFSVQVLGYGRNLIIENNVIVELKSIDKILPIHEAQNLTYMKLAKASLGLRVCGV